MTSRRRCAALALVLAARAAAPAGPGSVDRSIVPAHSRTVWNPGLPGGVPADGDPARPATVWLPAGDPHRGFSVDPALGRDGPDAAPAINAAIQAAGDAASAGGRKIVRLAPGVYRTRGVVRLDRSFVTLRGAGKGKTVVNHVEPSDPAAIDLGRTAADHRATPTVDVVGGAPKGATRITVEDASGFAPGDILQIDQLADGAPNGPEGRVWILDAWWSMRSPWAAYPGGGGLQGKFPDSPGGHRPVAQQIEVLAKEGRVLTIHDPVSGRGSPLHVDFPAARDPEVWRAAGAGADVARWTGLEDLSVWSASRPGDAKDMIAVGGAAFCWVKNVETDGTRNVWAGRHVHLYNGTYRFEVRELHAHGSSSYAPGANAYGIVYSGSECLIEDNVVRLLNKPIVGETTGGGNVVAYNYVDEAILGSPAGSWQETGIDMSHAAYSHSDLFEGNHTPNLGVDSTHGNNGGGVFFRNFVTGRNGSGRTTTYLRAIFVDGWSRETSSIGNVLWQPGAAVDHGVLDPSRGVNPVHGAPRAVYLLGSNAWVLGTGRKPGADRWDDGQAARLFHRHLDFDYRSNAQHDDPANPVKDLPDSLYLPGKPAFFGAHPWPWVDPGAATHRERVRTLPAKARFDAGRP